MADVPFLLTFMNFAQEQGPGAGVSRGLRIGDIGML